MLNCFSSLWYIFPSFLEYQLTTVYINSSMYTYIHIHTHIHAYLCIYICMCPNLANRRYKCELERVFALKELTHHTDSSNEGIHFLMLSICQKHVREFCLSMFEDFLFFHLFFKRKQLWKLRPSLVWISQQFSSAFTRMWKQMIKIVGGRLKANLVNLKRKKIAFSFLEHTDTKSTCYITEAIIE